MVKMRLDMSSDLSEDKFCKEIARQLEGAMILSKERKETIILLEEEKKMDIDYTDKLEVEIDNLKDERNALLEEVAKLKKALSQRESKKILKTLNNLNTTCDIALKGMQDGESDEDLAKKLQDNMDNS